MEELERKRELKWITQVRKLPRDCPPGGRLESEMAVRCDNKMQEEQDPDKKVESGGGLPKGRCGSGR